MGKIWAFLDIVLSLLFLIAVLIAFLPYITFILASAKWRRWRASRVVRSELRRAGFSEDLIKELEEIIVPRYPELGGVIRWLTSKR